MSELGLGGMSRKCVTGRPGEEHSRRETACSGKKDVRGWQEVQVQLGNKVLKRSYQE